MRTGRSSTRGSAAVGRQLAAGDREVVRLEDADRLLHRDPGRGQPPRIERDDEAVLEAAGQVRRGDARDCLELGDDLVSGDCRRFLEVVDPLAETDATTTGAALKLNVPTVGSTPCGKLAVRRLASIVAVALSRSVP